MSWTPTAGMRRAHDLVEKIGFEAAAAESLITPLFKHRLVELIAGEIDEAVDIALNDMADRAEAAAAVTVATPLEDDFSALDGEEASERNPSDSSITGLPATPYTNGNGVHVEAAKPERVRTAPKAAKKAKGGKKGTLKLSGAARRKADKALKEAAAAQAMENLPVPIDGMERT